MTDFWLAAKKHLRKADPVMGKLISQYTAKELLRPRGDAFFTLARAIAGQQISVKAADSIWRKIETALREITPEHMLQATTEQLRACGLSERKVMYMHALAEHFQANQKRIRQWPKMADEEILDELVSINGIGRWTAEMFLIFHLARPDVLPVGDLGLLKAIYRHYNHSEKMPLPQVRALAEHWRPYRSVAT